jgi:hypothetical protein
MGYPVITRLGLNQFWYRHWNADTNSYFSENITQDKLFIKLIKFYLNYGLNFSQNIFFSEYFFTKFFKSYKSKMSKLNVNFFRKFYFSNTTLGIEHAYLIRVKTGEYFPLRVWCIKYSSWIILSFHCFKPVKKKHKFFNKFKKELYSVNPKLAYNNHMKFIRCKILLVFIKKKLNDISYFF